MSIQWPNIGLHGEFTCDENALAKINENFKNLDALAQISVTGQLGAVPMVGSTGEKIIVSSTGEIWVFTSSWENLGVQTGYVAFDETLGQLIVYNGTAWIPVGGGITNATSNTTTITGVALGPVGSLVYKNGLGSWELADHTNVNKVAIAIIVEVTGVDFKIQTSGPVTLTAHGYTIGDYYFGDKAVLGGVTNVKPNVYGDVFKSIFHVTNVDTVELLLQNEPMLISTNATPVPFRQVTSHTQDSGQVFADAADLAIIWNGTTTSSPAITLDGGGTLFTFNEPGNYTVIASVSYAHDWSGSTAQVQLYAQVDTGGGGFIVHEDINGVAVVGQNVGGNRPAKVTFTRWFGAGDVMVMRGRQTNVSAVSKPLTPTNYLNWITIAKDNI